MIRKNVLRTYCELQYGREYNQRNKWRIMMKRKVFLVITMVSLLLALCACGKQSNDGLDISENSTEQSTNEEEKSNETEKASVLELTNVLDEINTDIQPGTAGSDLASIRVASHLLNWGVGTSMGTEEIKKETIEWLSDKGNAEQVDFSRKLAYVYDAYKRLLGSNSKELLDEAGCDDAAYPWSDSPVETIETIIDVVQLPEDSAEPLDKESTDTQSTTSDINNSDNANSLANNSEIADDTQTDTYPGPDVAEIVNLKGDETTVYKLVDGRYMDRVNAIFIFDGVDTWTDENGVEWNEIVKQ